MLISLNWLQEYCNTKLPSPQETAKLLTFHSFEVEGIQQQGDDAVLDVDVLPNRRHDCLSHRGIAREIAVLTNTPFNDPFEKEALSLPSSPALRVSIKDREAAVRYTGALVENVSVKESPDWLKQRLAAMGQQSINNIVDATNYVMFALGQPLHAFDAGKLSKTEGGYAIGVRSAREGERITTLDDAEYELSEGDALITDDATDTPIGIAGIKGGKESGIDEQTTAIILESANFNPARVRKTSERLKLRTDASIRFESALAPEQTLPALSEALRLIQELSGGEVAAVSDEGEKEGALAPVTVSAGKVNAVLGLSLTKDDIVRLLEMLGFSYEKEGELFKVTPPFERLDITFPEALIEEIGRVYGYSNVSAQTLPAPENTPAISDLFSLTEHIRSILVRLGFSEIYTHAIGAEGQREIENPLAQDKHKMRSKISAQYFTDALELNRRNVDLLALEDVRLFEIGKVFSKDDERWQLALAVAPQKKAEEKLKEAVAALEAELGEIKAVSYSQAGGEGAIALVELEELPLPDTVRAGYPEMKTSDTAYFRPISPYPFVLRDIAVWTPEETEQEAVARIIRDQAGELLEVMRCFDVYPKEGFVSYAFRLVFQSQERTLSDAEINAVMAQIEAEIHKQEGWSVR